MNAPISLAIGLLLITSAAASERVEQTRLIDGDGVVEISNVRGTIQVEGEARSDVSITGELGDGVLGLEVKGDLRRLTIRVKYPESSGGWFSGWSSGAKSGDSALSVKLPLGVTLVVNGVSADINVSGLAGKRAEINSVSGEVTYAGSAAELAIDSVSGDVQVSGSASDVTINTVSGDSEMQAAVSRRLRFETVSGDARLIGTAPLQTLEVDAVSGDLELSLIPASGARFTAGTLSGDIELDLGKAASARLRIETFSGNIRSRVGKVEKEEYGPGSRLDAELGSGDADVKIETFSGSVTVRTP